MPTVRIHRDGLFRKIGRQFSDKEFDELCFEFGIELDEVVEEENIVYYKIEIPANRYDILCVEGLSLAIRVFLGMQAPPHYQVSPNPKIELRVKSETKSVRPFVVGAVLRDVTLDKDAYDSFIDYQDKLHQNICRKRTLVAIGTHDLDTLNVSAPFSYEALPPQDIAFVPLNLSKCMTGSEIIDHYSKDSHMRPFAAIIKDEPRFPIIFDSSRTVLSLPPLINGDHSKLSVSTKNVFIECTATDLTKASVVLNNLVCAFATYCSIPFVVEPVRVVYEKDGRLEIWPHLASQTFECSVSAMSKGIGISVDSQQASHLLRRMMLDASVNEQQVDMITVHVPPCRADILHQCDIEEDLAISFGFNKIAHQMPPSATVGYQQPLNRLADQIRLELAMAGYTEVLTLALCSREENIVNGDRAVKISNPKTVEFQVARTSLIPGLLKTLSCNKTHSLPMRMFEVSDVVLKSDATDTGARNERRLAALYSSTTSGFEVIHGVVDRVLAMLSIPTGTVQIAEPLAAEHPFLFPGRSAAVYVNAKYVGFFGVLHPDVLKQFDLSYPVSVTELNLELFC
nr:phenylalanyl-tRNA synthetase beta subunit [Andalucia godoyi]|eukprot:ANDGO_06571.mRNA.1 Phenylalanine--tRNA ligase beta subunit